MSLEGRVLKVGDHVDTDRIIPARYLTTTDPTRLAAHCLEGIEHGFPASIQPGDVLVAGENFGCGSSREHAPLAIKGAGIACVVARSYARIFYRNALNVGLPILICPPAADAARPDDRWRIDLASGRIENIRTGDRYDAEPVPAFMLELIRAGGLIPVMRERLARGVYVGLRGSDIAGGRGMTDDAENRARRR